MPEPGLQLEQRHRFLGVVELAGDRGPRPVAGDVAANVGGRDTCFGAQRRDDRAVDVVLRDGVTADGEQDVDVLAGLAVQRLGLRGPDLGPRLEGLSQQRIDGFGECRAGLVHGHVEQADGVVGQHVPSFTGDGVPLLLPAHAADPEPGDLIAAQTAEQPSR